MITKKNGCFILVVSVFLLFVFAFAGFRYVSHTSVHITTTINGTNGARARNAKVIIYLYPPFWSTKLPKILATRTDNEGMLNVSQDGIDFYSKGLMQIVNKENELTQVEISKVESQLFLKERNAAKLNSHSSATLDYEGFTGSYLYPKENYKFLLEPWELSPR